MGKNKVIVDAMAKEELKRANCVVLVCCIDHRIGGRIDEAVAIKFNVLRAFKITCPGVSKRLLDREKNVTCIEDIGFALEHGAQAIILCHHGEFCAAYGSQQDQQIADMKAAAVMLQKAFDVPVLAVMQDNPAIPIVRVVELVRSAVASVIRA